jgi:sigma-E factor negative regulatory protein RseA
MSNKHAEELCAMMDGELGRSEARFLLRRLGHEQHLIARWKRYHYSRAVLRGDNLGHQVCLCDRISVAIAQEPAPTLGHSKASGILPAWLRPVAGFSLAASVAIAAFTLVQDDQITPVADQTMSNASVSESAQLPSMPLRAQPASAGSASYNPRLQAYVMRHNAVASARRGRDLVPYIYLVTTPVSDFDQETEAETEPDKNPEMQPANGVNE